MPKILAVAKDMGAASVVAPTLVELARRGHTCSVVVEGLAPARFRRLGINEFVFQGTRDFTASPFSLDVPALLDSEKPDVVVIGFSYPTNLEFLIAEVAIERRIPLAGIEDFWGSGVRMRGLRFDLHCVVDELSASLSSMNDRAARQVITGNPGITERVDLLALDTLVVNLRDQHGRVTFYSGGGPSTSQELELLVKSWGLTMDPGYLILGYHPKWVSRDSDQPGKTWGQVWDEIAQPLVERGIAGKLPGLDNNQLVLRTDATVSSFSTLLASAAGAGKAIIVIDTPEGRASLAKQSDALGVPLVTLGLAKSINEPRDLGTLFVPPPREQTEGLLRAFSPPTAATAIEELLAR